MRKYFALTLVALLALTLALAVVGCGGQKAAESTPPAETMTPPAETAMPESAMMSPDTTMGH